MERLPASNRVLRTHSTNAENTENSSLPPSYFSVITGRHKSNTASYFPNETSPMLDPRGSTYRTLSAFSVTPTNENSSFPPSYSSATNNTEAYTTVELPLSPNESSSQISAESTLPAADPIDQRLPSYSSVTIDQEIRTQIAVVTTGDNASSSQINPSDPHSSASFPKN